ncbi:MAG: hypothetical protein ACKO7N_03420, partial [Candidatus Nitrosotenuis sp.]
MSNNRIYYAIQQVKLGNASSTMTPVHGLQSVGITTNFNLEQVFEMGQLSIYQNVENVPDIEVTLNKVLDGYQNLYSLATESGTGVASGLTAVNPTIPGRQNARTDMQLAIFSDTNISASGNSINTVTCSGMYVSSVGYTFPVDGNFTEDVTLVGNNKVWGSAVAGSFNNSDAPIAAQGVGRRQFLNMSACRFPTQIPGVSNSGTNDALGGGSGFAVHFQNINVRCDFGREAMSELGTFAPYHRYVRFPVEVTSEFEVMAISGDMINATESGYYVGLTGNTIATPNTPQCSGRHNLLDQTIFLESCEGTRIYLGTKNKLTSVNYNGGDAGGDNVSVTYSYQTFNDLVVA